MITRADIDTLLSLDQYAHIIGAEPRHFNQMTCAAFPERTAMGSVWYQEQWMESGHASRAEVARSIADAEYLIAEVMGQWPAPKFIVRESVRWPSPRLPAGAYPRVGWPRVFPKWGGFIGGGQRCADLAVEFLDISLDYIDPDGDGWNETVTFSVVIPDASLWDVSEVGIFPHEADPIETNRIRYLRVKIAADDTVTVSGNAAQFIVPALWENREFINGDDISVFLTFIDIYRVHLCDDNLHPAMSLLGYNCANTIETQHATLGDYAPVTGSASAIPVTWSIVDNAWAATLCGCPMRPVSVSMNYLAGFALTPTGAVHPTLATAIAALATARLTSPISGGGESIEGIYPLWQELPEKNTYPMRECPFGIRYGAWQAWQTIRQFLGGYDAVSI